MQSRGSGAIYASRNDEKLKPVLGLQYKYDQLNRIKGSDAYFSNNYLVSTNNSFAGVTNIEGDYKTQYSYDFNGNILSLTRNGYEFTDQSTNYPREMDDLTYEYYPNSNKLKRFRDAYPTTNCTYPPSHWPNDLEDMCNNTFEYDEIGNLIEDKAQLIDEIKWTNSGKVKEIIFSSGSNKNNLEFYYNASGNRIAKVEKIGTNLKDYKYTYYVHDAQGNVLSVYHTSGGNNKNILVKAFDFNCENYNKINQITAGSNNLISEPLIIGSNCINTQVLDDLVEAILENYPTHLVRVEAIGNVLYFDFEQEVVVSFEDSDGNTGQANLSSTTLDISTKKLSQSEVNIFGSSRKGIYTNNYRMLAVADYLGKISNPEQYNNGFTSFIFPVEAIEGYGSLSNFTIKINNQTLVDGFNHTYTTTINLATGFVSYFNDNNVQNYRASYYKDENNDYFIVIKTALIEGNYADDYTSEVITFFNSGNKITQYLPKKFTYNTSYGRKLNNKNFEFTNHLGNVLMVYGDRFNYNATSILNNTFDNDIEAWTFNSTSNPPGGISQSNGKLNISFQGTTGEFAYSSAFNPQLGEEYIVTFDVTFTEHPFNLNAFVTPDIQSQIYTPMVVSSSGTYSFNFVAIENAPYNFYLEPNATSGEAITIDNVTIKPLGNKNVPIYASNDYYPFGMHMPGRGYTFSDTYRYGFNGQEKTDEISGSGNHNTALFWEYDTRLGRRWNLDPFPVAWESGYVANRDNPIGFTDPLGDWPEWLGGNGPKRKNRMGRKFTGGAKYLKGHRDRPSINWNGIGNLFRDIKLGPPAGRMVNQGWSNDWHSGSLSTQGNPIDRTMGVNLYRDMVRNSSDGRVSLTGIEVNGNASAGTSFRITGGLNQAKQRSLFATNGLQNLFSPSSMRLLYSDDDGGSPLDINYFEARSGFLPGFNFLPTAAVLGSGRRYQDVLRAATIAWQLNMFNQKPISAGTVWSLRFSATGFQNGSVNFKYHYKWSAWQSYLETGKSPLMRLWHRIMWGSN